MVDLSDMTHCNTKMLVRVGAQEPKKSGLEIVK